MSMNTEIYQDISTRTAGDIYIGVVGPVRAGKSTFIKRFMETQVIPNIDNVYRRERAKDELPHGDDGGAEVRAGRGGGHRARRGQQLLGSAHRLRGLYDPGRDGADGGREPAHGLDAVARPRGDDE